MTKPATEPPPDLAELMERYLNYSLAGGASRGTVSYRKIYLRQLADWLLHRGTTEARQVTPQVLRQYVAHVCTRKTRYKRASPTRLSPTTVAAEASVLRSFFGWLTKRRLVLFNPAAGLKTGSISGILPKAILTVEEMRTLLAAPGNDPLGLRDRAILETLYSTGLRRAELCNLDRYDIDTPGQVVMVRQGKGGRDRVVPIGKHALAAIQRYSQRARPFLMGKAKEPALFIADITGGRISVKTLNRIVPKHGAAAGIKKRVTPHVLRHTCATHLLQGGADMRHVQEILGHASVSTTQIYTRVALIDLREAHQRHHPRAHISRFLEIPR